MVYYTKTGKTQKVAQMMYRVFKEKGHDVDIFRIKSAQHVGWIKSIFYTITGRSIDIRDINKDLSIYDIIIIGGPVWASLPAAFVNAFIDRVYSFAGKKVVTYVTMATQRGQRAISTMNEKIAKKNGQIISSKTFRVGKSVNRQTLKDVKKYSEELLDKIDSFE